MGFVSGNLDLGAMAPHLKEANIASTNDALLDAASLQAYFRSVWPNGAELADCTCGGESLSELAACPFCGDAEDIDEPAPEQAPEVAPEVAPEPEEVGVRPFKAKAETKAKTPKSKVETKAKTPKPKAETEPVAGTKGAVVKKVNSKKSTKKSTKKASEDEAASGFAVLADHYAEPVGEKTADKKTNGKANGVSVLSAKEAKALGAKLPEKATLKALDKECAAIKAATKNAAGSLVKLATAFRVIDENDLWKLRVNDRGERAYLNFGGFAMTEFGVSRSYAYQLVAVAKNFSDEDIREFGIGKLRIAASLPKDKQKEALEGGGTVRDVSDRAKGLSDGGERSKPPAAPKNPVTVAVIEGHIELVMQKRSTAEQSPNGEDTSPATALDQDPWAVMQMENSTQMEFRLQQNPDDDTIALHIVTSRVTD